MLPRTVSHGNTPYSWNITPRSGPGPATGLPSSSTRPEVGLRKPAAMFMVVVLPQPEGPMTETNSRSLMVYETWSTTLMGPAFEGNSTETFSNTMRGPPPRPSPKGEGAFPWGEG